MQRVYGCIREAGSYQRGFRFDITSMVQKMVNRGSNGLCSGGYSIGGAMVCYGGMLNRGEQWSVMVGCSIGESNGLMGDAQ